MTEHSDLTNIILTDNVTYEEASRIASLIIDEGWVSESVLESAKEAGYKEATDILVEMHEQYRCDNENILDEEFDQDKLQAVERDMRVGGVTTYSNLQAFLAARWHKMMAETVPEMLLPMKKVAPKHRKR